MKRDNNSSGSVLFELAIIVPLLVGIGLGGIELARALRAQQSVAAIAREAANEAFRNCGTIEPDVQASFLQNPNFCLRDVQDRMRALIGMTVEVEISIFQIRDGGPNRVAFTGGNTRFTETDLTVVNLLNTHEIVVVGEATTSYTPAIHFMPGIFSFANRDLYDFAIY